MNFKLAIYFFLAGTAGVIFGGLFLGLALDGYFSGQIETGDLPTWVAALGTLFTLWFLINQNLEKQQHELSMWADQKEVIRLDKFEKHRGLFMTLLSEIEEGKRLPCNFFDRNYLYKRVFVGNSLEEFSFELPENLSSNHIFEQLKTNLVDITNTEVEIEKNGECLVKIDLLVRKLIESNKLLQLQHSREPKLGDVIDNNIVLFNIFDFRETYDLTFKTMNTLRDFSSLNGITINYNTSDSFYKPFSGVNFIESLFCLFFFKKCSVRSRISYLESNRAYRRYSFFIYELNSYINKLKNNYNLIGVKTELIYSLFFEVYTNNCHSIILINALNIASDIILDLKGSNRLFLENKHEINKYEIAIEDFKMKLKSL
ncbi:hypothetical protein LZS94_12795 [Aliivibrio fischeri]|uniref:hypothetical protein n=1 Tax=Aliivibrio fischeri TaxID=668 RepID=UPI001F291CE0|nr:hypothetical protein [Aliivibrio fischeri]MCE7578379.1 hypothetical protein [Aliivibrio fischeri]MCE7590919.1 hypothetical protein [Aliivibrio fischeri]